MLPHSCPYCLSEFTSTSSKSKFCSHSCHSAAWRVGYIYKCYWRIRINGKQICRHRFVMEEALGRLLAKDEVVHHKNGDKLDNAIENLVLLASQSDYMQEHRRTYSSTLDRQYSKCRIIKSFDNFYLRDDSPAGCTRIIRSVGEKRLTVQVPTVSVQKHTSSAAGTRRSSLAPNFTTAIVLGKTLAHRIARCVLRQLTS